MLTGQSARLFRPRGSESSGYFETGADFWKICLMEPNILRTRSKTKAPTGIEGFDEITHGGLPRGRTTLLEGGPGSGKTIMALQSLVNGARLENEPGIFVAFEESAERLTANVDKFGWDLAALQKKKQLFFSWLILLVHLIINFNIQH